MWRRTPALRGFPRSNADLWGGFICSTTSLFRESGLTRLVPESGANLVYRSRFLQGCSNTSRTTLYRTSKEALTQPVVVCRGAHTVYNMTKRCSDTHFWAEGVKVPSGRATYTHRGETWKVVCGRHRPDIGSNEIHVKMLSNTATINLEVPSARDPGKSVTLNLKVKKDRLAGKKGRADIEKRLTYADEGRAADGLLFNLSQMSQGGQDYKAVMGRLWIFSESLSEADQLKLVPAYAGDNHILEALRRHSRYASVQRAAIDLISSQKTLMSLVESTTGDTQDLVISKLSTPMAIAEELRGMYWRKASSITKEKLLQRLGELLAADVSEGTGEVADADELSQQIAYAIDLSYRAPNRYNVPFEEDIAATRAMLDGTRSWVVRRYLAETTDRVTTIKLATSDPHPEVRAVAIENLGEEQDLLYKTILEEPVARVRAAGAAVLEDLSAVEFLIWKDPAISVRMSALGTMKYGTSFGPGARDEEEGMRALTRVLAEHPDRELRLAAAKYIKEPGPKEAFAYSDPDPKVRLLCLRGVKDQAVLEKVVTTDPSEMVCRALLSRLKGTDIFFTLAASSPHPGVRQLALRYTDDDTRIAAAVASTDKMLRRYALKHVQDPQRLVELRRVSDDEELVKMAGTRLPKDLLEAHVIAA